MGTFLVQRPINDCLFRKSSGWIALNTGWGAVQAATEPGTAVERGNCGPVTC